MTEPKRIKVLHGPDAVRHYAALREAFAHHPEVRVDADGRAGLKSHEIAVIVVFVTPGAPAAVATGLKGYQRRRFPILPVVEDLRRPDFKPHLDRMHLSSYNAVAWNEGLSDPSRRPAFRQGA